MRKVEICLVDYLKELGAEACINRDFINDLKEEVLKLVDYKHKPHVAAWRSKGDNLIVYFKTVERTEEMLACRGKTVWYGGYI